MRRWLAAALLAAAAPPAAAEQFVEADGFRVHYSALASSDVAPETARQLGITRGRRRGLLVLSPQVASGDGFRPVAATAEGTVRNLVGHVQTLALRAAREGEVHYVIAEFSVLDQEWMVFDVRVRPEGAPAPLAVRFKQQFYTD